MLVAKEASRLRPEQRRDYERAAVALENGDGLPVPYADENLPGWAAAAWTALAMPQARTEAEAARLLRECIREGRTLS